MTSTCKLPCDLMLRRGLWPLSVEHERRGAVSRTLPKAIITPWDGVVIQFPTLPVVPAEI